MHAHVQERLYDVIILGAGPAGMALAQGCRRYGASVLLIESEETLGGVHRVDRRHGMFSEHGPRIYNTNYRTVERFFGDFQESLNTMFRPYNFDLGVQNGRTWWDFPFADKVVLGSALLRHLLLPFGTDRQISVAEFAERHGLHPSTLDYLDRVCRFSDGGDATRYTLFELFELVNQHSFIQTLEPCLPNDVAMIPKWEAHLRRLGVDILVETKALRVQDEGDMIVVHVKHKTKQSTFRGRRVVMAMPPPAWFEILAASPQTHVQRAFGAPKAVREWIQRSLYMPYGSMTFLWNTPQTLPRFRGFPRTDWGILFVVMSSVTKFDETPTVVSCAITVWDVPSSHTGKRPADYASLEECRLEAFRQWKEAIGAQDLPKPDHLIGDNFLHETDTADDAAFFRAAGVSYLDAQSPVVNRLYQLGCQNGRQKYNFTSMEAAVSNAAALLHTWFPQARHDYPIHSPVTLRHILYGSLIALTVLVVLWMYWRPKRNNKRFAGWFSI